MPGTTQEVFYQFNSLKRRLAGDSVLQKKYPGIDKLKSLVKLGFLSKGHVTSQHGTKFNAFISRRAEGYSTIWLGSDQKDRSYEELDNTLKHELAHAYLHIVGKTEDNDGHGPLWKEVWLDFGGTGRRYGEEFEMSKAGNLLSQFDEADFDDEDLALLKLRQQQHQKGLLDDEPDMEDPGISPEDLKRWQSAAKLRGLASSKGPFTYTGDEAAWDKAMGRTVPSQRPEPRAKAKPPGEEGAQKLKGFETKRATTVHRLKDGTIICTYHKTVVVEVKPSGEIILRTGGHHSKTTKLRMNQMADKYDLGYQVYQQNFEWLVVYKGETLYFKGDELVLNKQTSESFGINAGALIDRIGE